MRKLPFFFIVFSLLLFRGAQAQDATSNTLLNFLSFVPAALEGKQTINYVDYREMEVSRGINKPTPEDFKNRTDLSHIWFKAISNTISSGFWRTNQSSEDNAFDLAQNMLNELGFSFLDIDQALFWGELKDSPQQTLILRGNFNPEAIDKAFAKFGFVSTSINDSELWCKNAACESTTQPEWINFSNPLDGLDRVLVSANYIVISSDVDSVRTIANNFKHTETALPNALEYKAIVHSINQFGPLVQIQFFNPDIAGKFDVAKVWADKNIIKDAKRLKRYIDSLGVLPVYSLAALAQSDSPDNEVVNFALVYADKATADAAGKLLVNRLQNYFSEVAFQSMSDKLKKRGVKGFSVKVERDEETGNYVVLLPFISPKPSNVIQAPNLNAPSQPGGVYRLWMDEFWKGSPFLATEFVLPTN